MTRLTPSTVALILLTTGSLGLSGCGDSDKTRNDGVKPDESGVTVTIDEIHR